MCLQRLIALLHRRLIDIHLAAHLPEFLRHLRHALFFVVQSSGVVAHVLRDLHRAEVRPAHRAEVRDLHAVLGQRLVVIFACGVGIEPEIELILPAEVEAGA